MRVNWETRRGAHPTEGAACQWDGNGKTGKLPRPSFCQVRAESRCRGQAGGGVGTGTWWNLSDISGVYGHMRTDYFSSVRARVFWLVDYSCFGKKSSMKMTFLKTHTG